MNSYSAHLPRASVSAEVGFSAADTSCLHDISLLKQHHSCVLSKTSPEPRRRKGASQPRSPVAGWLLALLLTFWPPVQQVLLPVLGREASMACESGRPRKEDIQQHLPTQAPPPFTLRPTLSPRLPTSKELE